MKKTFIILATLLFLCGCGKSEEEKVNDVIAESVKSTLYYPDSYDPVSTDIKPINIDIFTNDNLYKAKKLFNLGDEVESLDRQIEVNTRMLQFGREYSDKLNKAKKKKEEYNNEINNIISEIQKEYYTQKKEDELQGYLVAHKFRNKNNYGNVDINEFLLILNKDKTNVDFMIDGNSVDFLKLSTIISLVGNLGEDEKPNGNETLRKTFDNIKMMIE